jgi:hypothetical protein
VVFERVTKGQKKGKRMIDFKISLQIPQRGNRDYLSNLALDKDIFCMDRVTSL